MSGVVWCGVAVAVCVHYVSSRQTLNVQGRAIHRAFFCQTLFDSLVLTVSSSSSSLSLSPCSYLQPRTIIQRCICCHCRICPVRYTIVDFTRLKLVQGKKEEEAKATAAKKALAAVQENDEDIMASYDAGDDEDIVF